MSRIFKVIRGANPYTESVAERFGLLFKKLDIPGNGVFGEIPTISIATGDRVYFSTGELEPLDSVK